MSHKGTKTQSEEDVKVVFVPNLSVFVAWWRHFSTGFMVSLRIPPRQ